MHARLCGLIGHLRLLLADLHLSLALLLQFHHRLLALHVDRGLPVLLHLHLGLFHLHLHLWLPLFHLHLGLGL